MTRAVLGLGSNLGDRRALLRRAVDALPDVVVVSPLYETDPVGGPTVTLGASGGLSSGLTGTTTSTSPTNRVALGVLPLALANGAGAGAQNAIGIAVIGGVVAATTLGVLLVPVFFTLIVRRRKRGTSGVMAVAEPHA